MRDPSLNSEELLQRSRRLGVSAIEIDGSLRELSEAIVRIAIEGHDLTMPLEQVDGGQKSLTLKAIAIKSRWRYVRSEDQGYTALD